MSAGQDFGIAFIGAGLASTAALTTLSERLLSGGRSPSAPLKIAVIDKSGEFFAGIAYGDRSGPTALTITPLDDFLPPPELKPFIAWMRDHQDRLAADLKAEGGALSQDLARCFKQALQDGTCAKIHVPRVFFGRYMAEKANRILDEADQAGVIDCHRISAEVSALERTAGGYRIGLSSSTSEITSRAVVLGLGSPRSRRLFSDGDNPSIAHRLIEDPYAPSMTGNLKRIGDVLDAASGETSPDVLLIGASASCLEILYLVNDQAAGDKHRSTYRVLSPQGRMPERFVATDRSRFTAGHLEALADRAEITAADLLDAVKDDLEIARAEGMPIGETLPVISRLVGQFAVKRLSLEQRQLFVNHVGVDIGRIQRRAGERYSDIVDRLSGQGRLHVLEGRFVSVAGDASGALTVTYRESATGELKTLDRPITLVINCSGSAGMARPNACPLIESVLETGLCRASGSSFGFEVDDHMAANDRLYVAGPMLAGNVVAGTPIWHVEHCGRILDFSCRLADELLADMGCDAAAA